jgi:molecular chaperone DnaK (HSP70)
MSFDCIFDIDANGILTVSATDKKNPDNKDKIIVNTKTLP